MKKTLKVWMIITYNNKEIPAFLKICRDIEESLGIIIDTKLISWNRAYDSYIQAFKDGNPPDVFLLGSTWVHTFSRLGYLSPVPSNIAFPPSLVRWMDDCATYSGIKYAVPWNINPQVLTTRKSYLEKYHISPSDMTDWESFYHVCEKIYEGERLESGRRIPFAFPVKPDINTLHLYVSFMYKSGWQFPELSPGNRSLLDHRVFEKVFHYLTRLMNISKIESTDDLHILSNLLYNKFYFDDECAFYIDSGYYLIAQTISHLQENKKYDSPFTLIPIPRDSSDYKSYAGGGLLVVSSSSTEQRIAWEIVKQLTCNSVVDSCSATSGSLPAYECAFWEKYSCEPIIRVLYEEVKNSTSYPFHPLWRNIEWIIAEGIYEFFWQYNNQSRQNTENEIRNIVDKMNQAIFNLQQITWEK